MDKYLILNLNIRFINYLIFLYLIIFYTLHNITLLCIIKINKFWVIQITDVIKFLNLTNNTNLKQIINIFPEIYILFIK